MSPAATQPVDHTAQIEARKLAATRLVGDTDGAAERVATAPAGYLLAHHSSDIARHCTLIALVPALGEARVVVTPGRSKEEWHIDVGGRDRPGLLAAFTGVLSLAGIDVDQAVLATWDDGAALQAFIVRSPVAPDTHALEEAFEQSLGLPLVSPAVPDAEVVFDEGRSDTYSHCEVRAADRPSLLHSIAVAVAHAGADVHAAGVTTTDGLAIDRFDLTDSRGDKLDRAIEAQIIETLKTGVTATFADRRPRSKRGISGLRRRTKSRPRDGGA